MHGDAVKIVIDAPPVDGKANEALTRFLAVAAGLPQSRVHLTQGLKSRLKVVQFDSLAAAALLERLAAHGLGSTIPPEATKRP